MRYLKIQIGLQGLQGGVELPLDIDQNPVSHNSSTSQPGSDIRYQKQTSVASSYDSIYDEKPHNYQFELPSVSTTTTAETKNISR